MEEEKAAAYYDELTRKGGGAARFKQGLGFSSASPSTAKSAETSKSSFYTSFIRASGASDSPQIPNPETKKRQNDDRTAQLATIRSKLTKKRHEREEEEVGRRSDSHCHESDDRRESTSRDRYGDYYSSQSRRHTSRNDRDRLSRERGADGDSLRRKKADRDYSRLIDGYSQMTPSEKVKAKMKLQISQTAGKDMVKGVGWERFSFDKDAPLEDEEMEVAEDDALLVKNMGKSFQFSAIEAKRDDEIKAAHDQAMFGAPEPAPLCSEDEPNEHANTQEDKSNLLSDKISSIQRGTWRDRVRRQ